MALGREYVDRHIGTIHMQPSELAVLGVLVAGGDRVTTREKLQAQMPKLSGKSVDVMLSRVRGLIGKDKIVTDRGTGWRLRGET